MIKVKRLMAVALLAGSVVGATGCEIYDSNSNGVYDEEEIGSALWSWWNCDVLGFLGDLRDWSCHPHM